MATGVLCAMGPLGVLAGSAINGLVTGVTSEGTREEKIVKGAVSFGSTLFWGSYGNGLAKVAGDGAMENFVFDLLFGSVAEIVNVFSQKEATKALKQRNQRAKNGSFTVDFDREINGAVMI